MQSHGNLNSTKRFNRKRFHSVKNTSLSTIYWGYWGVRGGCTGGVAG